MTDAPQWGYVIQYRAHFLEDGFAEMSAYVTNPEPLGEFSLQQLCLDNLPSHEDIPESIRTEDIVITRFEWTAVPPVSLPDVSQGPVSLDKKVRDI